LTKLASAKHRKDVLSRLYHHLDYDPKFAARVPPADPDLDGKQLLLQAALEAIVGMNNGVVLICIPGALAYYESEDMNGRFVLSRPVRPNCSLEQVRVR